MGNTARRKDGKRGRAKMRARVRAWWCICCLFPGESGEQEAWSNGETRQQSNVAVYIHYVPAKLCLAATTER